MKDEIEKRNNKAEKAELDLFNIFLSPPKSFFERVSLFLLAAFLFVVFFKPLGYENMSFIEAVVTASFPALTISWGWIVFLRYKFKRDKYLKNNKE
ncbi:MAG: hypothetical protein ACQEQD_08485 [Bacillota bacterium]